MPTQSPVELARALKTVEHWWSSNARPKTLYTPDELQRETGLYSAALADALVLLGWHRAKRWSRESNRRVLRTYYAPPGHRVPSPPRGRPSTYATIAPLIGEPDPYHLTPR